MDEPEYRGTGRPQGCVSSASIIQAFFGGLYEIA
jgi:hypothetical protein